MNHDQTPGKETLNYRLRPNADGVCLDVWENSPNFHPGQASYRFFVTYKLKSADDAQVILDHYLMANDVYQTAPSNETVTPVHLRTLIGAQF
ncbi:MAG: hypothetical protein AAF572_12830 [Cyanobacteria bacterium P01_B01_bin.77]